MLNLERTEKFIIAILAAALLTGIAVIAYQKSRPATGIEVSTFDSDYQRTVNSDEKTQKININKADVDELMALKGIGKILAERIVEHRSSKGAFASIDDIKNVKGVGSAMFDKIKDKISIE